MPKPLLVQMAKGRIRRLRARRCAIEEEIRELQNAKDLVDYEIKAARKIIEDEGASVDTDDLAA